MKPVGGFVKHDGFIASLVQRNKCATYQRYARVVTHQTATEVRTGYARKSSLKMA